MSTKHYQIVLRLTVEAADQDDAREQVAEWWAGLEGNHPCGFQRVGIVKVVETPAKDQYGLDFLT